MDRSGSTDTGVGNRGATVWSSMKDGLTSALSLMRRTDNISVWQFDNTCERLGSTIGQGARNLIQKLGKPNGGTELASAVQQVLSAGTKDILILTDG